MDDKDKRIAELEQLLSAALARITELEHRLGLNSRHSSKPPSSDGFRKKPVTQSLRPKGKKPSGGQVGHAGQTLAQSPQADFTVIHEEAVCDQCGADMSEVATDSIIKRQVFDIPEPQLLVTEHRSIRKRCGCGHIVAGRFPVNVAAPVQYGQNIKSNIVYYSIQQMIPEDRLQQLMHDMHGVSIATGTIASINARFAEKIAPLQEQHLDEIKKAPVKTVDETGFRVGGKTYWLHVMGTELFTHYRISPKRKDLEPMTGIQGTVVHDHWKSYFQLQNVQHSLCNAHHLRELKALTEIEKEGWAHQMMRLLKTVVHLKDPQVDRIYKLYHQIINRGLAYHHSLPQLGKTPRKKRIGHNLLLRLLNYKDEVLRFLTNPAVPFTNNQAERDLRMMKVKQKISGGFRVIEGAQIFSAIRGFISSSNKQGLNILDSIKYQFA